MKKQIESPKRRVKFLLEVVLAVAISVFTITNPVVNANILTIVLALGEVNEERLSDWAKNIKSSQVQALIDNNISSANSVPEIMKVYESSISEHNDSSLIDLIPISLKSEQFEVNENFKIIEEVDDNFIEDKIYQKNIGQNGKYTKWNLEISLFGKNHKLENSFTEIQVERVDELNLRGSKTEEEIKSGLANNWEEVRLSIANPANGALKYLDTNEEELSELFKIENLEGSISGSSIKNWKIDLTGAANSEGIDYEADEGENTFAQGYVELQSTTCNEIVKMQVVYNIEEQRYQFSNVVIPLSIMCQRDVSEDYISPSQIEILSCSDCKYAPVDKLHALPSNYAPDVVNTNLAGGGQLGQETLAALKELFDAAKKDGISLSIVSAYRSYAVQIYTFDFWVNREISYGRSREEAEIKANQYSARPGHSEHQLGTTIDLKDAKCSSYNQKCNKPAYEYISENAHKFGFAVSYPEGMQILTGYKYEPWHVRFVGKELAQKFFDTGYLDESGNYLSKFLQEKNLYN